MICLLDLRKSVSAHACSEIGLKWFLFAFYGLGTVLDFAFAPEFLAATSLRSIRNLQNGIKTIFDHFRNTHAR
jgi:Na+-transporting NADH:ubiquinone oxidoreductase subunit NqrB